MSRAASSARRGERSAPALRPGIIGRPVLVDRLTTAAHVRVVLVSAPAGYGKTTLLALWRYRAERLFAWLSRDAAGEDPVVLLGNVLTSFDVIVPLGSGIVDELHVPEPVREEVVLPSLIGGCTEAGQLFFLVAPTPHGIPPGAARRQGGSSGAAQSRRCASQ